MQKVKVGATYTYEPVGLDRFDARTTLRPGDVVTVVNLYGCPPANTMGHCHVTWDNGRTGLVLCNSLQKRG